MKIRFFPLILIFAVIGTATSASAQTIRSCTGADGVAYFTDGLCPDASDGVVLRQETPEARLSRLQSEAINYEMAQKRNQAMREAHQRAEEERATRLAERDAAIDAHINRARQIAADRAADDHYNSTRRTLLENARGGNRVSARAQREAQQALVDLEELRAAQRSGNPAALEAAIAEREQRQARARAADAEDRAERARNASNRSNTAPPPPPMYDHRSDRWCQSPAPGVINCF